MKRTTFLVALFTLVTLFTSFASFGKDLPTCTTGAWYDPAASGQGLFVEVTPTFDTFAWYTFNQGKQAWFSAVGTGNGAFDVFHTTGTEFGFKATSTNKIGTAALVPNGNDKLVFSWQFGFPNEFCSGFGPYDLFCKGSQTLTRLSQPVPCPAPAE
jgi:hypothetical protein